MQAPHTIGNQSQLNTHSQSSSLRVLSNLRSTAAAAAGVKRGREMNYTNFRIPDKTVIKQSDRVNFYQIAFHEGSPELERFRQIIGEHHIQLRLHVQIGNEEEVGS